MPTHCFLSYLIGTIFLGKGQREEKYISMPSPLLKSLDFFNCEVHIVKRTHINEQGQQCSEYVASKPDVESQNIKKIFK